MKYLISILFFAFSVSAFAENSVEILDVKLVEDFIIKETAVTEVKEDSDILKDESIAFECYYTMEWLYKECPFIGRIQALV